MSFYTYGFICGYRAAARADFGDLALAQADYDRGYAAGQLELKLDIKQHQQLNAKEFK
jgi:hypothetical protein